jgi:hypothetical protein
MRRRSRTARVAAHLLADLADHGPATDAELAHRSGCLARGDVTRALGWLSARGLVGHLEIRGRGAGLWWAIRQTAHHPTSG